MDLFGPVPSSQGYTFVLTATCLFTKWVEAEPLADKTADSVFKVFMKLFHRWGVPRRIITDQGKEFNNQVCIADCLLLSQFFYMQQY